MNPLYSHMPYFLKTAAVSALGLYKRTQRYGKFFRQYYDFLSSSTIEEQKARAQQELASFLERIRRQSTFYQLPPGLDIRKLPIIDKDVVLKNYDKLRKEKPYVMIKTSGTTGRRLAVPYSKQACQKEYAFWWYHRSFGGVKRGDRIAAIMGHKVTHPERKRPPFWVVNYAENQLIFSPYHLSKENLKHYVGMLNKFRPHFVLAAPSSIYLIAQYVLENDMELQFRPKMIVTASETLFDFQRHAIEKAFDCRAYIWYGNTELCGHITECPHGRLHVQPYHSYVRIVDGTGRDVSPGEEGFIVGTNFSNTAFPLINYNTRDIARLSSNQDCGCGRGGQCVDYIRGRAYDYIVTPDGRLVGNMDYVFSNAPRIRLAQIEQNRINEVIIRIERARGYNSAVESRIEREARDCLGKDMNILFEYVDTIPRGPGGKFKFIIQNMRIGKIVDEALSSRGKTGNLKRDEAIAS